MKAIRCWDNLERYGIVPLISEACGLMYRILCDVTARGKRLVEKAISVAEVRLAESWNRGTDGDPHIGSIMLGPELLPFLGVFALLEDGCREVWLTKGNGIVGIGAGIIDCVLPASTPGDLPAATTTAGQMLGTAPSGLPTLPDYDKTAATTPQWWIDRATAATKATQDSLTRASLWLRIGLTQAEAGDRTNYRASMAQARRSAVAARESMCFEQNRNRNQSETNFRPRFVTGAIDSNTDRIGAIIDTLLEIETVHHQQHEPRESIDTLLCADEQHGVLELIRVDLGGPADHVARKCALDVTKRLRLREFSAVLAKNRFRLVVITATKEKATAVRQALDRHDWPDGLLIHFSIVPQLLSLTASRNHA